MSRLYSSVRLLNNLTSFFERKLSVFALVNFEGTKNRNFHSYNLGHTYKWRRQDPLLVIVRSFAKDKGKSKLKKGVSRIPINDQELSQVFDVEKLYNDFKMPVDYLRKIYVEQCNLRTNTNSIQDIKVNYDGDVFTVQDLAEIKKKTSKNIILDMGRFNDAIPSVIESLRNSPLNISPAQEGSSIIIPIPKVTQEFRESLVKKAKIFFNKCKDSIRDVQNKKIKQINQKEGLPVDDVFRLRTQVTALGEKQMDQAKELYKAKEKELLSTD